MKRKNQKGFTLVEVMVSVFIVFITMVGTLQLYVHTSRLAEIAGDKSIVLNEAQNKMDEIRNTAFSLIASTYPTGTTFALPSQLTGSATITLDTSNSNIYGVTITMTWKNKKGFGSTLTLVSRIANK